MCLNFLIHLFLLLSFYTCSSYIKYCDDKTFKGVFKTIVFSEFLHTMWALLRDRAALVLGSQVVCTWLRVALSAQALQSCSV